MSATSRPIDTTGLPILMAPAELWPAVARLTRDWLDAGALAARDAIIVLPFAELLPLCKNALALGGGWVARVESLRTLAASVPPRPPESISVSPGSPKPAWSAEAPSGDSAVDRLLAARWLTELPDLRDWRRREPAAFEHAAAKLVDATHGLMAAAAATAPSERENWWANAAAVIRRASAAGGQGAAGGLEGALLNVALHWARLSEDPASDAFFAWQPSAWIVLQAGAPDPLTEALLQSASARGVACLRLVADPLSAEPFDELAGAAPQLCSAASAEAEAWAAASAVIDAVNEGCAPVALIAQDRLVVRRVRALLERQGVSVADESGWALSTSRSASHLMALLRATQPSLATNAGMDALLDGLKACVGSESAPWLDDLERRWRRFGGPAAAGELTVDVSGNISGNVSGSAAAAQARWEQHRSRWQAFAAPGRRTLCGWLRALSSLADDQLPVDFWHQDLVAERVRSALRLDQATVRGDVDGLSLDLDEFAVWVECVLEKATYIAPVGAAQVVITPLARAMLRPFGAVVVPGADAKQLGVLARPPALLPEAMLRELGMDDRVRRQRRAELAFAQLLRHPRLLLLRRRMEGPEPLSGSPWVERLQAARALRGLPALIESEAPSLSIQIPAQPVLPPAACAADALPDTVSASAIEALRACPYRFFARSVLRLSEADELEADPGKRDYGSLLHEALYHFHEQRKSAEVVGGRDEHPDLIAHALAAAQRLGLQGPAMLPFAAGLDAFAERYLRWLAGRDAEGWRYAAGELALEVAPEAMAGLRLKGCIDRIDRHPSGASQLIDYKTGSLAGLRDKVREPLEDTQLAFYAAQLLLSEALPEAPPVAPTALSAIYLGLDDRQAIESVQHANVAHSAGQLIDGLAHDWQRLRGGAPLLALGEGQVCATCEARGLCRRDHWSDSMPAAART